MNPVVRFIGAVVGGISGLAAAPADARPLEGGDAGGGGGGSRDGWEVVILAAVGALVGAGATLGLERLARQGGQGELL